jgi:Ca2+-binding RTX toxin-like protein
MIENLEQRQLMSVSAFVEFGTTDLYVMGDGDKDEICIERKDNNGQKEIRIKDHGKTVKVSLFGGQQLSSVPESSFNDIYVYGNGGDDKLEAKSTGSGAVKKRIYWFGGDGNDRIRPGKGKDIVNGGFGNDTIDYSKYSADVEVRLNSNLPEASGRKSSDTDRDTLLDIENANGGKGNDLLLGNSLSNKLKGGDGDDVFDGGLGADKMDGDDGFDTFHLAEAIDVKDEVNGGDDSDTVYWKTSKDVVEQCENVFLAP